MLRGWIRSVSPLAAGYAAGAAAMGMLSAYDWCIDGRFDVLPALDGCHCWIASAAGLILGLVCAALVPLVRRLLEPLIAHLWGAIARLAPGDVLRPVLVEPGIRFTLSRETLARRRASRAPPLFL